jgi:hypothetical protein
LSHWKDKQVHGSFPLLNIKTCELHFSYIALFQDCFERGSLADSEMPTILRGAKFWRAVGIMFLKGIYMHNRKSESVKRAVVIWLLFSQQKCIRYW